MVFKIRRGMHSEKGPGWAVTDWGGHPLPGRWPTKERAMEQGLLGVYLLSGVDVVEIKRNTWRRVPVGTNRSWQIFGNNDRHSVLFGTVEQVTTNWYTAHAVSGARQSFEKQHTACQWLADQTGS